MANMHPFKAASLIFFLAAVSLFETRAKASQEWLERINDLTQQYIRLVDSTVPSSARVSQNRLEFIHDSWIDASEHEQRLNRLVEKLVNEECIRFDYNDYNEGEGVLESDASAKPVHHQETITQSEGGPRRISFLPILAYSNACLEQFESTLESMVWERGQKAWSRIAESNEVLHLAIRSRLGLLVAAEQSSNESIKEPGIKRLALVFGRSVIPSLDLPTIEPPSDIPFATWEETRLLAMRKYAVPHSTWLEFQSFSNASREVRISKGYRHALR
jgi:hypothetical protein